MMKEYFQLFRSQTYPATMLCLLTTFLYKNVFDFKALLLLLLAIPLHYFSFGHNSVMDYWYDLKDVHKKHHPLITGKINLFKAHNLIHTGLVLTVISFITVTFVYGVNVTLSLTFLCLCLAFGHAYNDGLGKSTILSFIPISLCFTSLSAYGWFMSHNEINIVGLLAITYVFFNILYQIAWEGNLKDVESDKINLLRWMGVKCSCGYVFIPKKVLAFGYLIRVILLILIIHISLIVNNFLGLIFQIPSLYTSYRIMTPKIVWGRGKALLFMSLTEILTIYALLFTLVSFNVALMLGVYGVLYFFICNKVLWGVSYPRV